MRPPKQPWPLLVAGTITRDDVRTPMGVNTDGLGGSATYFTLAARLFAPVSVVGTAGPDFMPAFQDAMRNTGADLRSVVQSQLATYRWHAEHDYETGTTRNERSDQGAYRGFTPVLTADQRKAKIVFLGSMEPRHQMRVLEQLEAPWLVAGDTMKLYIREQPDALARTLVAERRHVERVARRIAARRPRVVVLVARGSSDNAALFGRYALELATGVPVSMAAPSVHTLYRRKLDLESRVRKCSA